MYYTPLIYSLDHPLLDLSDFLGLQGCPYTLLEGPWYRNIFVLVTLCNKSNLIRPSECLIGLTLAKKITQQIYYSLIRPYQI
jgi:hypothetical protein